MDVTINELILRLEELADEVGYGTPVWYNDDSISRDVTRVTISQDRQSVEIS
jgi:hypothetical protein